MKTLKLIILLAIISISSGVFAQTELVVEPGFGTLNAAINENQGSVIYKLKAGAWYGLDATIQNSGFPLTIIGEMPPDDQTMPPIIQTGINTDGTTFVYMFDLMDDFTLKNVFVSNQDQNGGFGTHCFHGITVPGHRLQIDNCVFDPVARYFAFHEISTDANTSYFFTNNLFITLGSRDSWGAHFLQIFDGVEMDSLVIENNTFVNNGVGIIRNEFVRERHFNFVWINHNSFILSMGQYGDQIQVKDEYYFTNNLFWGGGWYDNTSQLTEDDMDYTPTSGLTSIAKMDTVGIAGTGSQTAGCKFSPTEPFTGVAPLCPSWGNNVGSLTLRIWQWNTDYATTTAGTPIAEQQFVDYADNSLLMIEFAEQPAGDYLWELSQPTEVVGVWKWTDAPEPVTSYFDGEQVDGQYRFFIRDAAGDRAFTNGNDANQVPVQIAPGVGGTPYESLPSSRKAFIEYNGQYVSDKFSEWVQADQGNAWIKPIIWGEDVPNDYSYPIDQPVKADQLAQSREYAMFKDKTNFPNFRYGHSMYDIDPGWTDERIYPLADSLFNNFAAVHVFHKRNDGNTYPQSLYTWDIDGWNNIPFADQPVTWPRFDGSYTNKQLLTASIEGLPLGDLNWFPKAKALWEANQDVIIDHIKSLNTDKIDIGTDVETSRNQPAVYQLDQNYPNPFNPVTTIYYSLKKSDNVNLTVYNMLGQKVRTLVDERMNAGKHAVKWDGKDDLGRQMSSGVYFYTINSGPFSKTMKMLLMK